MNYIKKSAFFLLFFLLIFSFNNSAHAQNGAGISLTPATLHTKANPGDVLTETLIITNESLEEKEFFLYKKDIKQVEAGGVPVFAEEGGEVTGFEISEWIELDQESVVIAAGGQASIPMKVVVPENASPGSHFGGVFASVAAPKLRQIGAGVGYEVASIITIRISGDIVDSARVRSFSTDKLIYGEKKVNFEAVIENQGNILIQPRGPLTITGMFGKPTVILVNDTLAGVFPESQRTFEFAWEEEGLAFGRYEAVLALVYDGDKGQKTIDAGVVFWVLPSKVIVPMLAAFGVLILAGYVFTKLYVRRAVARASGGRRVVQSRRRKNSISKLTFVFISLLAALAVFLIVLLLLTV